MISDLAIAWRALPDLSSELPVMVVPACHCGAAIPNHPRCRAGCLVGPGHLSEEMGPGGWCRPCWEFRERTRGRAFRRAIERVRK